MTALEQAQADCALAAEKIYWWMRFLAAKTDAQRDEVLSAVAERVKQQSIHNCSGEKS